MEKALIPVAVPPSESISAPTVAQHFLRELLYVVPPVRDFDVEVVTESLAEGVAGGDFVRVDSGGDVGHAED